MQVACASACVEADDLDGARAAMAPVLDRPPGDMEETNLVGLLHFATGKIARAREVYVRGLARWGDWAALLFNVAVCDLKLGRLLEARGYLERLVTIRPRHRRAWMCLAIVHTRMGEPHLARAAFAQAREAGSAPCLPAERPPYPPRAPDLLVAPPLEDTGSRFGPNSRRRPGGGSSVRTGSRFGPNSRHPSCGGSSVRTGLPVEPAVQPAAPKPAEDNEEPRPKQASLVDAELAFVPRSIPVGALLPPARGALANVLTAVLAAAAGFALVFALDRRPPSRPPVLAPSPLPTAPSPLVESAKLRTAPPTTRDDLAPAPAATGGVLRTPESARGHRVFVDGRLRCGAGDPIRLPCGMHEVQVGSAGRKQHVVIPCGGEIEVDR
jgi:hypothetical protein